MENQNNNLFASIKPQDAEPPVPTQAPEPTPLQKEEVIPSNDVPEPNPEPVDESPRVNFHEKYPSLVNEIYGEEAEKRVAEERDNGGLTLTIPSVNLNQLEGFGNAIDKRLTHLQGIKSLYERHEKLIRDNAGKETSNAAQEWQKLAADAIEFGLNGIDDISVIDTVALNNQIGSLETGFTEEVKTLDGLHYAHRDETFYNQTRQQNFQQFVQSKTGMELHGLIPNSTLPKARNNQPLTGKAAVLRVQAMLGMAGSINIPLWHSGFWITLRTPNDIELINFYKKTAEAAAEIGRSTNGLALSNNQGYIIADLMELVISCMERCTLEPSLWEDKRNITKYIRLNDVETLAWGLACCMYPKGFQFTRSSFIKNAKGEKELVPVTGLLNLRRAFWVDRSVLTDEQVTFMSNVTDSITTEDDLKRYLKGFAAGYTQNRTITLMEDEQTGDKVTIDIANPTVRDSIRATDEWVALLSAAVDRVTSVAIDEMDGEEVRIEKQRKRRQILENYASKLPLAQYSGWFQQITIRSTAADGAESFEYIDDRTSILSTLTSLPMEVMRNNNAIEQVLEFSRDVSFALMATPTVSEYDESPNARFKHLVPINPIVLFFILCHWRVGT